MDKEVKLISLIQTEFVSLIFPNPDIKRPLQVIGLTEYEEEFTFGIYFSTRRETLKGSAT